MRFLSEFQMQKYGLSFDQISAAISRSSVNIRAGKVDSKAGQIRIMTRGQGYVEENFKNIVVLRRPDGARVLLKDAATIVDGFVDQKLQFNLDGKKTTILSIIPVDNPDAVKLSRDIREYVDSSINPTLPDGIEAILYQDNSKSFESRLNMMLSNDLFGILLIFAGLSLFLTPRLAG